MCRPDPFEPGEYRRLFGGGPRKAVWGDFVPLGYFATWACEPNPTLAETMALLERARAMAVSDTASEQKP